jgi:hypothetical protein
MSFNTQDHFDLFRALKKLVLLGQISTDEMESLLTKSGLTKIGDSTYRDESGAILEM